MHDSSPWHRFPMAYHQLEQISAAAGTGRDFTRTTSAYVDLATNQCRRQDVTKRAYAYASAFWRT